MFVKVNLLLRTFLEADPVVISAEFEQVVRGRIDPRVSQDLVRGKLFLGSPLRLSIDGVLDLVRMHHSLRTDGCIADGRYESYCEGLERGTLPALSCVDNQVRNCEEKIAVKS